jgi:hypothetical protein
VRSADVAVGWEVVLAGLVREIRALIAAGPSNADIRAGLELLDNWCDDAIDYLRARPVDFE